MSPVTQSLAGALLLVMVPIVLCQPIRGAGPELANARAQWDQGNYGEAKEKFEAYLNKHDAERPAPYEARAYYASSLCHISGKLVAGHAKLLEVQKSLDRERELGEARSIPAKAVVDLNRFIEEELLHCKPATASLATAEATLAPYPALVPAADQRRKSGIHGTASVRSPEAMRESHEIKDFEDFKQFKQFKQFKHEQQMQKFQEQIGRSQGMPRR